MGFPETALRGMAFPRDLAARSHQALSDHDRVQAGEATIPDVAAALTRRAWNYSDRQGLTKRPSKVPLTRC